MRIEVIILLLLLVPIAYAQEEYQHYQSVSVNTKISSDLVLDNGISYLSSELSFFPRETDHQDIINKEYSHKVIEKQDSILYEWNNLPEQLTFAAEYDIKSLFNIVKIKNKIPFPIEVPHEYEKYLEPTSLINSNHFLIKEKAQEIIGNEDDLYEVVYKLASWNKENIEYSLETLTEELTQDSIWVLQNKKGVCDELTVLFIAMLRSQGIPAKFISGGSYTNLIDGFGNHAWSEVYFPGKGWVPFDVTYGEMGYVDATHIEMKESNDAKEPSVKYKWTPGGKDIDVKQLNISTIITGTENLLPNYININLKTLKTQIKSGSYFPLEIELENTQDYYLSTILYLTKAPAEIENNVKHVLLKPNEKKKVYWILNVPDGLDNQYIYTSKIEIIDFFKGSDETEVEYANKYAYYSLEEAQEKVSQLELENKNPESSVSLFCSPDKLRYYSYEDATLVCKLNNEGKKSYDFNLCFIEDCKKVIINPSEEKEITFNLSVENGNKEYHAQLSDSGITISSYFDVEVISVPELKINNLNYPEEIAYKNSGEINFDLFTESAAKNLVMRIDKKKLFEFETYEGNENFALPFNAKYFYGKNSKLIFEYEDHNGKKYKQEQEINIKVTNIPFYIVIGYWWFLIIGVLILFVFRKKFFKSEPPKKLSKI